MRRNPGQIIGGTTACLFMIACGGEVVLGHVPPAGELGDAGSLDGARAPSSEPPEAGAEPGDDAGDAAAPPPPSPPPRPCVDTTFTIATKAACTVSVAAPWKAEAEGFINDGWGPHRIFTAGRWGRGWLMAYGDVTTVGELLTRFDGRRHLTGKATGRVGSFGNRWLCTHSEGSVVIVPEWITHIGEDLPESFRGSSDALADAWDALILCRPTGTMTDWSTELADYVTRHGKTLLVAMDYVTTATTQNPAWTNKMLIGSGVAFATDDLNWAPMTFAGCL